MEIQQQDWVGKWAIYSPDKVALREAETGRELTYGQWNLVAKHLARHLQQTFGIKKGDRIAILSENRIELLILFAVAQKTGCILVPLNYRLTSSELDFLLQNASPSLLIAEAQFEAAIDGTNYREQAHAFWKMEQLAVFCENQMQQSSPIPDEITPVQEDDPVFILYTSGTTGFPKGAIYSHKMLFWNSINTAMSLVINTESRTINCLPPFHTGGWNVLTTPLIHHGGFTCLMKRFDAQKVLELNEQEQTTIFMGVPTVLRMMADLPGFEDSDLRSLYYIIVGGEPMPIPLIERYHKKGIPIRQGYGMTEVGPNLTSLHQSDAIQKKGSIGRPNFYVQIKIVDSSRKEVAANQAGELLLKGPMVTPGYWNNPEATAKTISEGWLRTGDMVRQDEEGYLFVVDRIKNMYISGGENVYPAEVERVINSMEGVQEVAVIGVPDEKWGETGAAFIVSNLPEMASKEIHLFCRKQLAKFKVPKHFFLVKALPKNDTGKIDRKQLQKTYKSQGAN